MTEDERFVVNAKIQEYCQYWVQVLGLQKWTVIAQITDNIKQKMSYDVNTGTALLPVITEERWKELNPTLPYDMEVMMVHNLLRLLLESKRPTLSLNYLARVLVQFKRTVNAIGKEE